MSSPNPTIPAGFFVVAREPGAEHPALPTWANDAQNPAGLECDADIAVERRDVEAVPGAFQLLDVLSRPECSRLVALSEALGYLPDAAVSLPRAIRHNDNVTWVADESTTDILWRRCAARTNERPDQHAGRQAVGLNARFRFYRYRPGDFFKPHTDGAWPGSRVVDRELITNAFDDRFSQLSFIVFLTDDYVGGSTQFYLDPDQPFRPARGNGPARVVDVRTPAGGVLCFPHGLHPLHCLHSSETIVSGTKYIIRSDVLFGNEAPGGTAADPGSA